MKKGLLVLPIAVFGMAILTPLSASAHSSYSHQSYVKNERAVRRQDRKCQQLEKRELRAWKKFDQTDAHSVNRVQKNIDRQESRGFKVSGSIVEKLTARGQFNTLAAALSQAKLVDTLNGEGNFTVFAPTDQAFAKLGQATIDAVLADPATLTNILTYHVVDPAKVPDSVPASTAVTLSSAPMLNGQSVAVELRDGKLFINDSQVVVTNIKATNGIVHVIDTVLMPN